MRPLRFRLPPLHSVMTFEAVARLQSMTKAARELRVTREAVSRQIRTLEQFVGTQLFERDSRTISLTPNGKEFAATVSPALEQLAFATESLQNSKVAARLTVTASVAISSYWLTPRLTSFSRQHPEIDIRVIASDTHRDLADQGADIGLWYGDGSWPLVEAVRLFASTSYPICSAEYLASSDPIETPEDLLRHTLIHLEGVQHSTEDWDWWLSRAGLFGRPTMRHIVYNSYVDVIQAAIAGQGIALGYSPTIDSLVERKAVVTPLDTNFAKGFSIYRVTARNASMSRPKKQFCDWLETQVKGG